MRLKTVLTGLLFPCLALLISSEKIQAQAIDLVVGDSLYLGFCTGDSVEYAHIDVLVKTRFPHPEATYNRETGEGFYSWFFNGDIDSRRLPCTFLGMKFRIAAIHTYPNEDGSTRTVVFGQILNEATVLWIEIAPALESREVRFEPIRLK